MGMGVRGLCALTLLVFATARTPVLRRPRSGHPIERALILVGEGPTRQRLCIFHSGVGQAVSLRL